MDTAKRMVSDLLQSVGITINGPEPHDIQIHNEEFYSRVLHRPELNLGETYIAGWWDCARLDQLFARVIRSGLRARLKKDYWFLAQSLFAKVFNMQSKRRALVVGKKHYDLGQLLFQCMLDPTMNYTCGYWANSQNLYDAQRDKMKMVCEKLQLKPGMRLLDIGCGWGGLAKYAAEHYGVEVVGVTISKEQQTYAVETCRGLPVEIRFQDYRDLNEKFDRICSIGMFEHVGPLNYSTYMSVVQRCLIDDGIFLLHTIGNNFPELANDWIRRYIFPNGYIPTVSLIAKAMEGRFVMEDWHNFGADYDKTLMAWHHNFNKHWDVLKTVYDERFYRIWNYYLLSCAGGFRARSMQLWQVVFTKEGMLGGYRAPRLIEIAVPASQDYAIGQ